MFNNKKRYLIVEEKDVTTVLSAISHNQGLFGNNEKTTGSLGSGNDPAKWYVRFYASDRQWGRIADELSKIGKFSVTVTKGGAAELYYTKD